MTSGLKLRLTSRHVWSQLPCTPLQPLKVRNAKLVAGFHRVLWCFPVLACLRACVRRACVYVCKCVGRGWGGGGACACLRVPLCVSVCVT